jgi:hypothetical protein
MYRTRDAYIIQRSGIRRRAVEDHVAGNRFASPPQNPLRL